MIAYTMSTSRCKTHEKKFGSPKLGSWEFCHFLKFTSIVFLDIAQDCSLGQCITSSSTETSKKIVPQILAQQTRIGPKWGFPAFSSYFIKRGKILLNWYFISADYI